jgi:uncharacterized cupredoxin-like copper-binding protein
MNLRPRRRLAAATALAALVSLSACASQAEDPDPPAITATATPTPTPTLSAAEKAEAFCKSVVELDTAMLRLGPPEDDEPTAGPTSSASPMSHDMGDESTAMPTPRYTAAAMSTATPDPTGAPESTARPESTGKPAGPPPADLAEVLTPAIEGLEKAPTIDAIDSDVDDMVMVLRKAVSTKDRDLLDSPDFAKAGAAVDKWMLSNCGYGELKGSAVDFEYDGLPKTLKGGYNAITLTNEGEEMHEMVLFRINDDVTEDFEALLKLPEGEGDDKAVPMGVVVVPPGKTGSSFFDLKPGRYGITCFIPKGSKNGKFGDGPPHFTEGMIADLTVT